MFYIDAKLHKFQSTKFCLAAPDVSVSLHTKLCISTQGLSRFAFTLELWVSVWNLLHITLLEPRY